jgi:hypothetical protein
MKMPDELLAPPPRDPLKARRLLSANRKSIQMSVAGMVILPALFLFLGRVLPKLTGYEVKGLDAVSSVWISILIDAFIGLFVAVFIVQMRRSERLFRDGRAVVGQVDKITSSSPDRTSKARYIFIDVTFIDGLGKTYKGRCSATGTGSGLKPGDEVPLLHLPADPTWFAIYDPELGMIPGRAKLPVG